ncbi:MAG TPA: trypsin-like peptidase domain-containing protein, partial [Polyangiaceae bacterium]
VASEPEADVSLLQLDRPPARSVVARIGDSSRVQVGEQIFIVGAPYGIGHTLTAGYISARHKPNTIYSAMSRAEFLQTDAAINQGNSGGPLLNLKGEVVGINAAIRANANNIGFAIPINMVKELLPILLRDGKVTRSALGVIVDPVNEAEAARLKRTDRKGAYVKLVVPGGGADRAGLMAGDVILAFDGKTFSDPNQLRWLASLGGVGKTVTIRVQRADKMFEVRVTLGPLTPSQDEEESPPRMGPLRP